MAIGKFTKKVTTYLSGKTLQMFRFDCTDSEMQESPKLKQIVKLHYRNNPPLGFKADGIFETNLKSIILQVENEISDLQKKAIGTNKIDYDRGGRDVIYRLKALLKL